MKNSTHISILSLVLFLILSNGLNAQSEEGEKAEKKYQAKAPKTQPFGKEAFEKSDKTTLRWLGILR